MKILAAACLIALGLAAAQTEMVSEAPADTAKQEIIQQTSPDAEADIPAAEEKVPEETAEPRENVSSFTPQVEEESQAPKEIVFPQDPRLSAFLSVTFPGLGQLYQGRYFKALLFSGSFLVSSGIIAYYANENRERSAEYIRFHDQDGNLVQLKKYNEIEVGHSNLDNTEKAVNIAAFAVVGVSYFWSVIDAYRSARAFNRKHFFSGPQKSASLVPVVGPDRAGVAVAKRF